VVLTYDELGQVKDCIEEYMEHVPLPEPKQQGE